MNVVNPSSAQDIALSSTLLNLSKSGILVLEYVQLPTPSFRVKQANAIIQQLVGGFPNPLVGAYVDQLPVPLNSPYLVQQLHQSLTAETPLRFHLLNPLARTESVPVYDCQLARVDNQTVILTIDEISYSPDTSQFMEQVLETMPVGLIIFRAVRNEQGEIVDFLASFCNQIGADISRQSRETILSQPISKRYKDIQAYELYHQYIAVVSTGKTHHQLLFLPQQDIWLDVSAVKVGDGLLVTFQDVTLGQKTASLLESVMKSSPAAVRYYEAIRDEFGKIVDFLISTGNELDAFRSFRPLESTVGKRFLDMYPDMKGNGLFDRYAAVAETGKSDQFELAHEHQGASYWFDCRAVRHGNGFVLTTLDITARKEAQLAEQRQAHLLQTVLDNSLTGVSWMKSVYDPAGQIVDFIIEKINETLAHTLGQWPQAIEGKRLSELMPHQITNGLFARYATVAQTKQANRFEWSNDTGSVWYDISVTPFEEGVIITYLDITVIKLAQLNVERQAELITSVLNSSPNSILVFESVEDEASEIVDFRIALFNPATVRMMPLLVGRELTSEDIATSTILELLPHSKDRNVFKAMVEVVKTRQFIRQQIDYPDLGISYDYDISPFRNGVLIITTDITALRQYQRQLEENNAALIESNEHLQKFAYVASHDLQEPLRKVRSFGDLLVDNYAGILDNEGVDLIKRMQSAAARMDAFIRDLLAYSRLSTNERVYEPQDLNKILSDVLSDLEVTIEQKGARLDIAELPVVVGDALQLRQLLQNLLSNALKFTRPDNSPLIMIRYQQCKGAEVDGLPMAAQSLTLHQLAISDNGIGFDQKYADRIFQMFQRLHTRTNYSGTGMGLAICKKIVENHKGYILGQSQLNQGATFTIFLPVD
jgi:signal transduction histidine kinase